MGLAIQPLDPVDPLRDVHARVTNYGRNHEIHRDLKSLKRIADRLAKIENDLDEAQYLPDSDKKREKIANVTARWHAECQALWKAQVPSLAKRIEGQCNLVREAIRQVPEHVLDFRDVDYKEEKLKERLETAFAGFQKSLSQTRDNALRSAHCIAYKLKAPLLIAEAVPAKQPRKPKVSALGVSWDAATLIADTTIGFVLNHPFYTAAGTSLLASTAISVLHSDLADALAPAAHLAAVGLEAPATVFRTSASLFSQGVQEIFKKYCTAQTGVYLSGAATLLFSLDPLKKILQAVFPPEELGRRLGLPPASPPPAQNGAPNPPAAPVAQEAPINVASEFARLSRYILIGAANAAAPFFIKRGFIAQHVPQLSLGAGATLGAGLSSLILSQAFILQNPHLAAFFAEVGKTLYVASLFTANAVAGNQGLIAENPALSMAVGAAEIGGLALISKSKKLGLAAAAIFLSAVYQGLGKGAMIATGAAGAGYLAARILNGLTVENPGQPPQRRHPSYVAKIIGGGIAALGSAAGISEHFGRKAIAAFAAQAKATLAVETAKHPLIASAAGLGAASLALAAAMGRLDRRAGRAAFQALTNNYTIGAFALAGLAGGTTFVNSQSLMWTGAGMFLLSATAKTASKVFDRLEEWAYRG